MAAANDLEIGGGRGTIHVMTAASLMVTANTVDKVVSEVVQIHEGWGYMWETEINLLEIGADTIEVCTLVISRERLSVS